MNTVCLIIVGIMCNIRGDDSQRDMMLLQKMQYLITIITLHCINCIMMLRRSSVPDFHFVVLTVVSKSQYS